MLDLAFRVEEAAAVLFAAPQLAFQLRITAADAPESLIPAIAPRCQIRIEPTRRRYGAMDAYYPNTAWLCLRRDVFDQLVRYKRRRGLPTWEHALEQLLARADGEALTP